MMRNMKSMRTSTSCWRSLAGWREESQVCIDGLCIDFIKSLPAALFLFLFLSSVSLVLSCVSDPLYPQGSIQLHLLSDTHTATHTATHTLRDPSSHLLPVSTTTRGVASSWLWDPQRETRVHLDFRGFSSTVSRLLQRVVNRNAAVVAASRWTSDRGRFLLIE